MGSFTVVGGATAAEGCAFEEDDGELVEAIALDIFTKEYKRRRGEFDSEK